MELKKRVTAKETRSVLKTRATTPTKRHAFSELCSICLQIGLIHRLLRRIPVGKIILDILLYIDEVAQIGNSESRITRSKRRNFYVKLLHGHKSITEMKVGFQPKKRSFRIVFRRQRPCICISFELKLLEHINFFWPRLHWKLTKRNRHKTVQTSQSPATTW